MSRKKNNSGAGNVEARNHLIRACVTFKSGLSLILMLPGWDVENECISIQHPETKKPTKIVFLHRYMGRSAWDISPVFKEI